MKRLMDAVLKVVAPLALVVFLLISLVVLLTSGISEQPELIKGFTQGLITASGILITLDGILLGLVRFRNKKSNEYKPRARTKVSLTLGLLAGVVVIVLSLGCLTGAENLNLGFASQLALVIFTVQVLCIFVPLMDFGVFFG